MFISFAKNELSLDVPMSGIIKVKRYDRFKSYSYAQYDMAQLLNIMSGNKYDTTIEEALKTFNKKIHSQKTKEE